MRSRRTVRGFTLIEMMVVVAIIGILAGLAIAGLQRAVGASRTSSAKFSVVNAFNMARQRAISRGRDVYVIFSNIESTASWPSASTARVLVYDDPTFALRGAAGALMASVQAPQIVDEINAAGQFFGATGLNFVRLDSAGAARQTPSCAAVGSNVAPYMAVTGLRLTNRSCTNAWCTFCEVQNAQCIGAVRFSADGQARVVTGPATGTGGLIQLVVPSDDARSSCIAITEPTGSAQAF